MNSEKTLNHSHRQKSINHPFVFYTDSETLLEKTGACGNNNPQKSLATDAKK